MSLPLKELIKIGQTQLKEAGVGDADRDARDLYCFLDKIDTVGLMMHWQDTFRTTPAKHTSISSKGERQASPMPVYNRRSGVHGNTF